MLLIIEFGANVNSSDSEGGFTILSNYILMMSLL